MRSQQCAFVFNGLLCGVALAGVADLLAARTREIVACNIGLIDAQRIHVWCRYTRAGDYYQLRWHAGSAPVRLRMVCSEELPGYAFSAVPPGQVFVL